MKTILLIGLGRFGRHVAMKLHELNHQVMAVDQDEEKVNRILPYVTSAQIGDSTNEEFLASLGVRNFDVCIVAIGDNFQSSLETASLLKEAGAKKVVARAARDIQAKFLLRNGADEVVYPERQIAVWTAIRYSSDNISDYIALGDDHAIFEIQVPDNWVGKTIGQLDVRKRHHVSILAIKQNGHFAMTVITPETCLPANSTMLVLNAARAEQEGRQHAECLKIAASDPCVMQPVFKTVSALKEQHPDLWCELSFGREAEVLGCLSTGNVDVAILPGETGGGAAFESRDFLFSPVSFRAVEDCTTLSSIDTSVRRQRILLKQNTSASLAAEFVQRICEQKP